MSIDYTQVTVVIQGNIRRETANAISSIKRVLPGATIYLSTFYSEAYEHLEPNVSKIILSHDPGPLPPYVKSNQAPYNNTNRQLRSTKTALESVITDYVLKIRSDCILEHAGFIDLYYKHAQSKSQDNRIIANSYFTRHPVGLCQYPFHISDWFIFGKTASVKKFFSSEEISLSDATWFDRNHHKIGSTYNAKRFRAKFTPEQFITIDFANKLGYKTPDYLNDNNKKIIKDYYKFLKEQLIIGSPDDLGFRLEKYDHIKNSSYQKIDCVSHKDWLAITEKDKKNSADIFRKFLNNFRHAIIRTTMIQKNLNKRLQQPVSKRPSLACFLTGVPRGNHACLESLRFITQRYDTTFIAVLREEFDTPNIRASLQSALPNLQFLIVPREESEKYFKKLNSKVSAAKTVIMMWHEIYFAFKKIDTAMYDKAMRTRYDIFYAPMLLPEETTEENEVLIPEEMSWSGSNDMIAFGKPTAMKKYSCVFEEIEWCSSLSINTPEMIASCSIKKIGLKESKLNIKFSLYRDELMSQFSKTELGLIALKAYEMTTYKLGSLDDTEEARSNWKKYAKFMTSQEKLFPTYQTTSDYNFYPPEIDARDGTIFRFMGLHGHLNRAIDVVKQINFTVCHYPENWEISKLKVTIDGNIFSLTHNGLDHLNRIIVNGVLEKPYIGKVPWSKICFSCADPIRPSDIYPDSTDNRFLTVSITEPVTY